MTLSNFPITTGIGPDWNSSKDTETRVNKTDFGDGYGQRTGDGINNVRDTWNVVYTNLLPSEGVTIDLFLRGAAGISAFLWQPPFEASFRKWVCPKWKISYPSPLVCSFSGAFMEVFDP